MRINFDNIEKKDLLKYLVKNKKELINQKKSMPIFSESAVMKSTAFTPGKMGAVTKDFGGYDDPNILKVKVVANTFSFADSYMDVLIPECCSKTIAENGTEGKNIISHLHDHVHTLDAKLGIVRAIYQDDLDLEMLGIDSKIKTTKALIFETDLIRDYNPKIFKLYETNQVNQHSIGLQYVKIDLAVNDPDAVTEFETWNKYIDTVVNADMVREQGFFWAVKEIKLLENSAVLFGANELTPTLEVGAKSIEEPLQDTPQDEPLQDTQTDNLKNITNNFSIKI